MRVKLIEQYITSLPDNEWYTEEDLLNNLYNVCKGYSKQGIKSFLKQIIINTPYRELFGSSRDLLISKDNILRKYIPSQDKNIPHYYYNKEKANNSKLIKQKERQGKFLHFKNQYEILDSKFTIPKKHKIAIIAECCSSKNTSLPLPAYQYYNNLQIKLLSKLSADLFIFSAGYGIIEKDYQIKKDYNLTFKYLPKTESLKFSKQVGWRNDFDSLCKSYDKVFVLLGDKYLSLLDLRKPFEYDNIVFMIVDKFKNYTATKPKGGNIVYVNAGLKKLHQTSNFNMKGKIIYDISKLKSLDKLGVDEIQYYIDNKKLKQ